MNKNNPIILAIDLNNFDLIIKILEETNESIRMAKFGLEFFYHFGIGGLKKINELFPNLKIFLDLKFYDIPNTVSKSLYAFKDIKNIELMTFHAQGGPEMLLKSREVLNKISPETKILAVTKLTSFEIKENEIIELAKDAILNGNADGIVSPAKLANKLKDEIKKEFFIISPGIRLPDQSPKDDQKAIITPKDAIFSGADFLVIGRPILDSKENKKKLLENILIEIARNNC